MPSKIGAIKPETTQISGQKRTWTENSSPEPEAGNPSQELSLRKTSIEDSNSLRKRAKINLYPENDSLIMPVSPAPSIEMTSALQFSRRLLPCNFLPEQEPDELHKHNSLLAEILAAINNSVMSQIELMRRDITDLYRENKKLVNALSKHGIHHPSTDNLKPSSVAMNIDTPKRHMTIEEPLVENVPSVLNPAQPLKPSRWGNMNNGRKIRIEENTERNNLLKNLTPADIAIKENAFIEDFKKLPLSPAEPLAVNIFSLVGDDLIARGSNRVVTDGESIWLEIPENWLCTKSFTRRQLTPSRQYFTLNGVTIHHQLETELGKSPRRHKLAVKIPRAEPSSRLHAGKWYIHAHQVKIASGVQGDTEWLKLRTMRLVKILRKTFRSNYIPRSSSYSQSSQSQIRNKNNRHRLTKKQTPMKNKPHSWEYLKLKQPAAPATNSLASYPMPMQAPPQWLNPYNNPNHRVSAKKNILPQTFQRKNHS